ncbi:endonuclease/exonuclease/phosphatase family protein [Auraticoccus monumenti]|uniref:endonuclease/exonuclease/phosphatase family protein n=1 Tax=Auraticoccus monumenti TaxID=675864 RepID=UPI000B83C5CD|nr:endonuclease/exonuclease/phosphatase family protein [Auraticoccus monumenti]
MRRRRGLPGAVSALVWVLCLPLLAAGAVSTVLSVWPDLQLRGPLALLASFVPLGVLAAAVAAVLLLVLALFARHRAPHAVGLLLAMTLVAVPLAPTVPPLVVGPPAQPGIGLDVVSLNLLAGQADPVAVSRAAAGTDVLVLVECTPEALSALLEAGLAQELPHRSGGGAGAYDGAVVLSRYPLETVEVLSLSFQQRLVRIDAPGTGPVSVLAAHPLSPFGGTEVWAEEHDRLIALARAAEPPVVVAGDLNAVDQHVVMHRWREAGFTDVGHAAGAGWVRTWPADRRYPPVLGIDHVLTGPGLRGVELSTFDAPGTDHLGLRAVVATAG